MNLCFKVKLDILFTKKCDLILSQTFYNNIYYQGNKIEMYYVFFICMYYFLNYVLFEHGTHIKC